MIAMEVNLTITITYLQLKTIIMHYRDITEIFLSVIGNAKLGRHSSFVE